MRIPKNENRQNVDFNVKRKEISDLLRNRCNKFCDYGMEKLMFDCEIDVLIRDFLTVLSNDPVTNITLLRARAALQDDESKQIYTCLFLCNYMGIRMGAMLLCNMVLMTLKNRLTEKGKDLSAYETYDTDFFFDEQYFSLPQFKESSPLPPTNGEIFIDCGAFDGDTVKRFIKFCKGKYEKIYSFEPNPSQYENTLRNIKDAGIQRVEVIKKGVWSCETVLKFLENRAGSNINDSGTTAIEVTAIDIVVPESENVTFIKMDVEGAEMEALKGAANTIRRCKPKLAVCIYHKPQDIIEIPTYIMALCPEYKLYIRHHFINGWETVLYALPPK